MITLSFYGAAGEVTGSCYLLQTSTARVLVDFGLHQGDVDADRRNRTVPPIEPTRLDAVILTHGHLDHCGRLPLLEQHGYRGVIYSTPASCELTGIILRDSAGIMEMDAEEENRRRARAGKPPIPALYSRDQAELVLGRMKEVAYGRMQEVARGVSMRFHDAGHIIGSASVELRVCDETPDGERRELTIVFSGDIGVSGAPLLRDPQPPAAGPSVVVLESTYGDRDHRLLGDTLTELQDILTTARADGGKVLIPAFAVGRTQDMIYHIAELTRAGRIPRTDVFIDSPMATAATRLYADHPEVYDGEAGALLKSGINPLDFPGLRFVKTRQESQELNLRQEHCVVIAGSGMCTGGRILHHLKHNLWRPGTHVVFVGYQAEGTLGRGLINSEKRVRILGEDIFVRAHIHTLGGFSAHAGQSGLIQWAKAVCGKGTRLFLTHGEDPQRNTLRTAIAGAVGVRAELPEWGDCADL